MCPCPITNLPNFSLVGHQLGYLEDQGEITVLTCSIACHSAVHPLSSDSALLTVLITLHTLHCDVSDVRSRINVTQLHLHLPKQARALRAIKTGAAFWRIDIWIVAGKG